MTFKEVERQLKLFFSQTDRSINCERKNWLKVQILEEFKSEKVKNSQKYWFGLKILRPKRVVAFSVVAVFLFNIFLSSGGNLYAGKIYSKYGVVEIIRDGKTILVETESDIMIDDLVRVGNKSEAEIVLPLKLISTAQNGTFVRITDKKNLFLEEGSLFSQSLGTETLLTENGKVSGEKGAGFHVFVSPSGETRVVTKQHKIQVYDKKDRQLELNQGEEIKLRRDTVLQDLVVPADLKLSTTQISAIRDKLLIARTKVGRGLEKWASWEQVDAEKDFVSAEKTFRSILQVGNSTRNLEILKRINTDSVTNQEVFAVLLRKTNDQALLEEIKATTEIFNILNANKQSFVLENKKTGLSSFDNYVVFHELFSLGNLEQQNLSNTVKRKYVIEFLRQIQDQDLLIDQISFMRNGLHKLPKNKLSSEFINQLKEVLSPDLAKAIGNNY